MIYENYSLILLSNSVFKYKNLINNDYFLKHSNEFVSHYEPNFNLKNYKVDKNNIVWFLKNFIKFMKWNPPIIFNCVENNIIRTHYLDIAIYEITKKYNENINFKFLELPSNDVFQNSIEKDLHNMCSPNGILDIQDQQKNLEYLSKLYEIKYGNNLKWIFDRSSVDKINDSSLIDSNLNFVEMAFRKFYSRYI